MSYSYGELYELEQLLLLERLSVNQEKELLLIDETMMSFQKNEIWSTTMKCS